MSLGLLMGGVYYLITFLNTYKPKYQWLTWLFFVLALSANLSLTNTFLVTLGLCFVFILSKKRVRNLRNVFAWIIGGLLPFIGFSIISFQMKERGLLYYGEGTGFIDVTVKTLVRYTFGTDANWVIYSVVIIGVASTLSLLLKIRAFNTLSKGTILALLFFGNICGTLALHHLLGVNFPEDRVGIYYIPLFLLCLIYSADEHQNITPFVSKLVGVLLIVIPISTISNAKFSQVNLWKDLPVDESLFEEVKTQSAEFDRSPIISGYRLHTLSWGYHNVRSDGQLPPLVSREYDRKTADFQICYKKNCQDFMPNYLDVTPNEFSDVRLLKRKEEIRFETLVANEIQEYSGDIEFLNLLVIKKEELIDTCDALQISFDLDATDSPCLIHLVVAARDSQEETVYYDFIPLHWIRNQWGGDRLEMVRPVKFDRNASHVLCYLWNTEKRQFSLSNIDVQALAASNPGED